MRRLASNEARHFLDLLRTFQEPKERHFLDSLSQGGNRSRGDRPAESSQTSATGLEDGDGANSDRENE
jgi:hypothetical protein